MAQGIVSRRRFSMMKKVWLDLVAADPSLSFIDENIRTAISYLNVVDPNLVTRYCCGGHKKSKESRKVYDHPYVMFAVGSKTALDRLLQLTDSISERLGVGCVELEYVPMAVFIADGYGNVPIFQGRVVRKLLEDGDKVFSYPAWTLRFNGENFTDSNKVLRQQTLKILEELQL